MGSNDNFVPESSSKHGEKLVITNEDRKQRLEQFSAQFAATCNKYQIAEEPSASLFGILDAFAAEQELGFLALESKAKHEEKAHGKRVKELEDQRMRLEKDLQAKVENVRITFSVFSIASIIESYNICSFGIIANNRSSFNFSLINIALMAFYIIAFILLIVFVFAFIIFYVYKDFYFYFYVFFCCVDDSVADEIRRIGTDGPITTRRCAGRERAVEPQVPAAATGATGGGSQAAAAQVRIARIGDLRTQEENSIARRGNEIYLLLTSCLLLNLIVD